MSSPSRAQASCSREVFSSCSHNASPLPVACCPGLTASSARAKSLFVILCASSCVLASFASGPETHAARTTRWLSCSTERAPARPAARPLSATLLSHRDRASSSCSRPNSDHGQRAHARMASTSFAMPCSWLRTSSLLDSARLRRTVVASRPNESSPFEACCAETRPTSPLALLSRFGSVPALAPYPDPLSPAPNPPPAGDPDDHPPVPNAGTASPNPVNTGTGFGGAEPNKLAPNGLCGAPNPSPCAPNPPPVPAPTPANAAPVLAPNGRVPNAGALAGGANTDGLPPNAKSFPPNANAPCIWPPVGSDAGAPIFFSLGPNAGAPNDPLDVPTPPFS
eukprot:444403-Rhodomonas_salina.1